MVWDQGMGSIIVNSGTLGLFVIPISYTGSTESITRRYEYLQTRRSIESYYAHHVHSFRPLLCWTVHSLLQALDQSPAGIDLLPAAFASSCSLLPYTSVSILYLARCQVYQSDMRAVLNASVTL
jgi:hypothetical protein